MQSLINGLRTLLLKRPLPIIGLLLLFSYNSTAEPAPISINIPNISGADIIDHEDYYFSRMLELALKKTEKSHGGYVLKVQPGRPAEHRLMAALLTGKIDVLWVTTSRDRETHMLPIRISLVKDLNNYRLLLIRKGDQAQFSKVKNLNDLRQLKGGINPQWTDADIMQHNGLKLVFGSDYYSFFHMLSGRRFDYFSRGLYQIHSEASTYADLNIVIEEELMLQYHGEFYFFVRKDSPELAERLTIGLTRAMEDGSFDMLFNSIPRYRWGMEQLRLNNRRIIPLTNP
jgi:hypothetical protein